MENTKRTKSVVLLGGHCRFPKQRKIYSRKCARRFFSKPLEKLCLNTRLSPVCIHVFSALRQKFAEFGKNAVSLLRKRSEFWVNSQ